MERVGQLEEFTSLHYIRDSSVAKLEGCVRIIVPREPGSYF